MNNLLYNPYDIKLDIDTSKFINPSIEDVIFYFNMFIRLAKSNHNRYESLLRKIKEPNDHVTNNITKYQQALAAITTTDVAMGTRLTSLVSNINQQSPSIYEIGFINYTYACCYFIGYTTKDIDGDVLFIPYDITKFNITDEILKEKYNSLDEETQLAITLATGYKQ
uniref:hypothetical protein n=1 Tax=Shewanella sp. TaxID=50422 RepID=UPI0040476877